MHNVFPGQRSPHLSMGTAVQTILWEVPAVSCWTCIPSRPRTFVGTVMEPLFWAWPHWPMLLVPQAYTSPSEDKTQREEHPTGRTHTINSLPLPCSPSLFSLPPPSPSLPLPPSSLPPSFLLTLTQSETVAISCGDVNDDLPLQFFYHGWSELPRLSGATPHTTAIATWKHLQHVSEYTTIHSDIYTCTCTYVRIYIHVHHSVDLHVYIYILHEKSKALKPSAKVMH